MYCVNCGSPVTASLSYCNRCGSSLREKAESNKTGPISAFLTAITVIAICGLGIMLGGSLVLRKDAGMPVEFVAFFMFFTFLIVVLTEIMLIRNLSRLTSSNESRRQFTPVQQPPLELHSPAASTFTEPVSSVTDNTTRTLEYARRDN
jgi:hypothetical protein